MQKNLIPIFFILLTSSLLTACEGWLPEAYKIDIQQGNKVKQHDLAKITLGMTHNQVKFVLGTPLLQDGFHNNRWDYVYYLKPGKDTLKQSRIVLYFNDGKLSRIDRRHYRPEQQGHTVKRDNIQQDEEIKVGHTH